MKGNFSNGRRCRACGGSVARREPEEPRETPVPDMLWFDVGAA